MSLHHYTKCGVYSNKIINRKRVIISAVDRIFERRIYKQFQNTCPWLSANQVINRYFWVFFLNPLCQESRADINIKCIYYNFIFSHPIFLLKSTRLLERFEIQDMRFKIGNSASNLNNQIMDQKTYPYDIKLFLINTIRTCFTYE